MITAFFDLYHNRIIQLRKSPTIRLNLPNIPITPLRSQPIKKNHQRNLPKKRRNHRDIPMIHQIGHPIIEVDHHESVRKKVSHHCTKHITTFLSIDTFQIIEFIKNSLYLGREKSPDSNSSQSSNNKKPYCEMCRDCRFYQDRFGPGFMDSFGPCSCDCHKWAYS